MAKAIYATGRRKEAVARVRMVPGSGNVHVNGRPIREYLRRKPKGHFGEHRYRAEDYGLTNEGIREAFRFYTDHYDVALES